MSIISPVSILYDNNGIPLSVSNGSTLSGTQALMTAGSDGTNSKYIYVDSNGRPIVDIGMWSGSVAPTLGQKNMVGSIPIVISSDQSRLMTPQDITSSGIISAINQSVSIVPIGCSSTNFTIAGTWSGQLNFEGTVNNTDWFPLSAKSSSGTISGTTISNGSWLSNVGSLSYFRVRASSWTSGTANIVIIAGQGSGLVRIINDNSGELQSQVEGLYVNRTIANPNAVVVGGLDANTGAIIPLATDAYGRLVTSPQGSSAPVAGFKMGYINTATLGIFPIRATSYTEQTVNARRSIVSSSSNDSSSGTGLRSIEITYYDQNCSGPYTEVVALNGVTPVNTVATDICYIENMAGISVGSGGKNAGIISLKAAIGGGGITIGSIAIGDNRTFWAHHYVAVEKSTHITSHSVSHSGTTVGSGATFIISSKMLLVSNSVEVQITDFVRLYGQSSTITRTYSTAIKVDGPTRITVYVTPETSSSVIYRSAFDFYDQ